MGKIIRNGINYGGTYDSATSVNYDNSNSGLNARTVQEGIDELSESLTSTSMNITPSVAAEYGYFVLRKYGNISMLSASNTGNGIKASITGSTLMCTLPEGYRPTEKITVASYHMAGGKTYPMYIDINADGSVYFRPFDNSSTEISTNLFWGGCVTWIVD